MTTDQYPTAAERELASAKYQLEQAEKAYQDAVAAQAVLLSTFGAPTVGYAVMAKVPDFQQFVAYPAAGVLVGIFDDRATAEKFARTAKAPTGHDLVVEETPHFTTK